MAGQQRLNLEDLHDVYGELYGVRTKWRKLGGILRVDPATLDAISVQYRDVPDDCLRETLSHWLKQVNPLPTWEAIVEALNNPVMKDLALAKTIEAKHCSGGCGDHGHGSGGSGHDGGDGGGVGGGVRGVYDQRKGLKNDRISSWLWCFAIVAVIAAGGVYWLWQVGSTNPPSPKIIPTDGNSSPLSSKGITADDFKNFDPPKPTELMNQLEALASKWRDIGEGLNVPGLDNIQANHAGSPDQQRDCLRDVFKKWHSMMTSDYSWLNLVEVLLSINERRVVKDLYKYLTNKK